MTPLAITATEAGLWSGVLVAATGAVAAAAVSVIAAVRGEDRGRAAKATSDKQDVAIQQIHVLTNDRLTKALDKIDGLEAKVVRLEKTITSQRTQLNDRPPPCP